MLRRRLVKKYRVSRPRNYIAEQPHLKAQEQVHHRGGLLVGGYLRQSPPSLYIKAETMSSKVPHAYTITGPTRTFQYLVQDPSAHSHNPKRLLFQVPEVHHPIHPQNDSSPIRNHPLLLALAYSNKVNILERC